MKGEEVLIPEIRYFFYITHVTELRWLGANGSTSSSACSTLSEIASAVLSRVLSLVGAHHEPRWRSTTMTT
ncbi:MAG: hypothetical protein IPK13_01840 [Deltaproteobacteria bacterium]|nr:hypothetical protein [Deltaproteobacteria bacterium]